MPREEATKLVGEMAESHWSLQYGQKSAAAYLACQTHMLLMLAWGRWHTYYE